MNKQKDKTTNQGMDIAIVGMACRFPGANHYRDFWTNLVQGVCSVAEIPPSRWDAMERFSTGLDEPGKVNSKWCGLLDDISGFDNGFFNISPREACFLDPQQRMLLEESWHCVEDSGISLSQLQQKKTAVYVGAMALDSYLYANLPDLEIDAYSGPGMYQFLLANRISYFMDLHGESKVVEAACASALVAIHEACRLLHTRQNDYALVAGINLHFTSLKYTMWSKNRMLSNEGKCKTFDNDANGFVSGEGIGVILLEPLQEALAQNHHIYGVIKGSAMNHGGKAASVSSPRVEAQEEVIVAACHETGFGLDTVTYIEAHGTGTSLGDPIEVEALTRAYQRYTPKRGFCHIGSVKTNIGHLEAASGMAGLIKVLLMLSHHQIPPTLNVVTPNSIVDFENTPFLIPQALTPWKSQNEGIPLRAGVSSFGFGGVNCHVIVEEFNHPKPLPRPVSSESGYVFALSAKNPESLRQFISEWISFLDRNSALEPLFHDICATLLTGREAFPYRFGGIVRDGHELRQLLANPAPVIHKNESGNPWYLKIGEISAGGEEIRQLCKQFEPFQRNFIHVLKVLAPQAKEEQLWADFQKKAWPDPYRVLYSFITSYAVASACFELGFVPDLITGEHSGLWAGLVVSQMASLEDILSILQGVKKPATLELTRPAMAFYDPVNQKIIQAFDFDKPYLQKLIAGLQIGEIAYQAIIKKARLLYPSQFTFKKNLNEWDKTGYKIPQLLFDDSLLTVSGSKLPAEKLLLLVAVSSALRKLNQKWNLTENQRIEDSNFYELLDLISDELVSRETVAHLIMGRDVDEADIKRNQATLHRPVQYDLPSKYLSLKEYQRSSAIIENPEEWLEAALAVKESGTPGGNYEVFHLGKMPRDSQNTVAITFENPSPAQIRDLLLSLWLQGVNIHWDRLLNPGRFVTVPLPVYPFQREPFWLPQTAVERPVSVANLHPLVHRNTSNLKGQKFTTVFDGNEPLIAGHGVMDRRVITSGVLLEMIRAAGELAEVENVSRMTGLTWLEPLSIGEQPGIINIHFEALGDGVGFQITSESAGCPATVHLQGEFQPECRDKEHKNLDLTAIKARCPFQSVSGDIDSRFRQIGHRYGPEYQGITQYGGNSHEALSAIQLPAGLQPDSKQYGFHPALLEGALQTALLWKAEQEGDHPQPFLLYELAELSLIKPIPDQCYAYVVPAGEQGSCNIMMVDGQGQVLAAFRKAVFIPIQKVNGEPVVEKYRHLLEKRWRPAMVSPGTLVVNGELAVLVNQDSRAIVDLLAAKQPVIIIHDHSKYKKHGKNEFSADLTLAENGIRLATDLRDRKIGGVVDLSNFKNEPALEVRENLGTLSLLQKLIQGISEETFLVLQITRGLQAFQNSQPSLAGANTAGFVKMLGAEYRKIRAKTIDVDIADPAAIVALIQNETGADGLESEVCYRIGIRYTPFLAELAGDTGSDKLPFNPSKVVVITGGTRGIGAAIARHLADRGARKLVLMGVQEMPPREQWANIPEIPNTSGVREKIRMIQDLESKGAQVRIYSGSLVEQDKLAQYFRTIRRELGEIGGLIHCAGLIIDNNPAFINKTAPEIQQVMEPKVAGLQILDRVFQEDRLDFFILFSSVSAVVPVLAAGLSDYAAANSFMDYFAAFQHSRGNTYYRSINWPNWKETGMATDIGENTSSIYHRLGFISHTTRDGLSLLGTAMGLKESAAVVPCFCHPGFQFDDLLQVRLERKWESAPANSGNVAKAEDAGPAGDALQKTLEFLKDLFSRELKIPITGLDEKTQFSNLGVDSIMLAGLVKKVEERVHKKLDPSIFFEYPTLSALGNHLSEDFANEFTAGKSGPKQTEQHGTVQPGGNRLQFAVNPNSQAEVQGFQSRGFNHSKTKPGGGSSKIAVVGVACHFPGAANKDQYWDNLIHGRSNIVEIPPSRWSAAELYSPVPQKGKSIGKWGGFIEGIEDFDPHYFGINEQDAPYIDPLIRQFLEVSVQTLRDAGYTKEELWDRKVGVFVGTRAGAFESRVDRITKNSIIGIGQNFIAAHISHFFNFKGPNLVVDTACSSSLVSIHLACQSLMTDESELALAGGVDILLDEKIYLILSESGALSPDGKCHTFDEKANGFVPGEGCGAVLLKRLDRAVADGDHIYAVIDVSAVNNDGHTMGITTPNPEAQVQVIEAALTKGRINPESISYIETHGTGTMIGDPIELRALTKIFRQFTGEKQYCGVGSVKTNFGHLLSAAGIASIIKVVLALENRKLPPTLNCETPNPRFDFKNSPFFPNTVLKDWPLVHGIRRAGISSFGFGGTNAHIILSEWDTSSLPTGYIRRRNPLPPVEFARKRYWVDKNKAGLASVVQAAPALDQEPDDSMYDFSMLLRLEKE